MSARRNECDTSRACMPCYCRCLPCATRSHPSCHLPFANLCSFIILKYLDMITIAVPPALPACLTVATAIAVSRLQQHDIFVSNPSAVTLAGHLNVLCFDKTGTGESRAQLPRGWPVALCTSWCHALHHLCPSSIPLQKTLMLLSDAPSHAGTLTEPGLDLQGVVPVAAGSSSGNGSGFAPLCAGHDMPAAFQELLATCHGLAQLGPELVGDPLDQRLFEATGELSRETDMQTREEYGAGSGEASPMPACHPSASTTLSLPSL